MNQLLDHLLVFGVFTLCCIMLIAPLDAQENPLLIPFQGYLTDQNGSPVPDGTRVIHFKLYNLPTGGTPVWTGELHTVSVNSGLVNVILGTQASLSEVDFTQQVYLEITVDIDGNNVIDINEPPMLPRQIIIPTINSHKLAGYDWNEILDGDTNNPSTGLIADDKIVATIMRDSELNHLNALDGDPINAVYVNDDGNVGVNTTSPAAKLSVNGDAIVGNGTPDNSVYLKDDGKVGIHTDTPQSPLHISGAGVNGVVDLRLQNTSGNAPDYSIGAGLKGLTNAGFGIYDENSGIHDFVIMGGKVGIGKTNPLYLLDVGGSAHATNGHLVGSNEPNSKLQYGYVTISFSGEAYKAGSVTFPNAYSYAPVVVVSEFNSNENEIVFGTTSVSTTGFNWKASSKMNNIVTCNTGMSWIAIGTN